MMDDDGFDHLTNREIDFLIAKFIMKLVNVREEEWCGRKRFIFDLPEANATGMVRTYSSSIYAAFEVLSRLPVHIVEIPHGEAEFMLQRYDAGGGDVVWVAGYFAERQIYDEQSGGVIDELAAEDPDPARAICIAALRWWRSLAEKPEVLNWGSNQK